MKKTTFTLLLSLSCCWLAAQCPADITFSTQGQVDSFQINYPGCMYIPGSVTISGNDITNLQGLSMLDSIGSCLWITNNPQLASLNGLENLLSIGECEKYLGFNQKGRRGLRIEDNPLLTSISGLHNLKSVKRCITISNNPSMTALNGLNSLFSVGHCQNYLSGIGWFSTHSIEIADNKSLKTIGGLSSLDSLRILHILGNDSLISLNGLENLRTINDLFNVSGNPSLANLNGLGNLQSIRGLFIVGGNNSLKNFHGLEHLKSICSRPPLPDGGQENGSLHVRSNFSLVDFSGLENLQSIGCGSSSNLRIIDNWSLQSLTGLGGSIDSLIELTIQYNPNLALCEIQPICDYLAASGTAFVSDNAPGCNSVPEIEAACTVPAGEVFSDNSPLFIFPNPTNDILQIQVKNHDEWEISLFDLRGRLLYRQLVSGSQTIPVQDWPSGLYALRAVSRERVFAGRFVKR